MKIQTISCIRLYIVIITSFIFGSINLCGGQLKLDDTQRDIIRNELKGLLHRQVGVPYLNNNGNSFNLQIKSAQKIGLISSQSTDPVEQTYLLLEKISSVLPIENPREELIFTSGRGETATPLDRPYSSNDVTFIFSQYTNGVKVNGRSVKSIIKNGLLIELYINLCTHFTIANFNPLVSIDQAIDILDTYKLQFSREITENFEGELIILTFYPNNIEFFTQRLAWRLFWDERGVMSSYIDAMTGDLIELESIDSRNFPENKKFDVYNKTKIINR
ncbi:MAG: hypothetical protein HN600_09125 [Bacteroidetes bacterium]|nr:hypothetical protein [Bacteroidota bacterium]